MSVQGLDIVQGSLWYRLYQRSGIEGLLRALRETRGWDEAEVFSVLVWIQREKDYHRLWLKHALREIEAPLSVWEMLGAYLNYHPGWAYRAYQEAKGHSC